jgi:UV DNA damage repair endonuclease
MSTEGADEGGLELPDKAVRSEAGRVSGVCTAAKFVLVLDIHHHSIE